MPHHLICIATLRLGAIPALAPTFDVAAATSKALRSLGNLRSGLDTKGRFYQSARSGPGIKLVSWDASVFAEMVNNRGKRSDRA